MDHVGHDLGRVLVTGAAGYLGRHVVERISAVGAQCIASTRHGTGEAACNLLDEDAVRRMLESVRPGVIVHCAAAVPKAMSSYDDDAIAAANLQMFENVSRHSRARMVFVSSMTVYSADSPSPVSEESVPMPAAAYARSKWVAERRALSGGPGDVSLRLPGLFGDERRSGLLYNAARAFVSGKSFEIASVAHPWAAMHVDDAAEYVCRAAMTAQTSPPECVNVGYEGNFSVIGAVEELARLCGVSWHSHAPKRVFSMDLHRLRARYGAQPRGFSERLAGLVAQVRSDLERSAEAS